MAQQNIMPPMSAVDTTASATLGQITEDSKGNEFIYLGGVASTVAGSLVVYNPATFLTTLALVATAGRAAVAMGACLLGQYGWYAIRHDGVPVVVNGAAPAVGGQVFASATPGQVASSGTGGRVENAYFTTATTPAGKVNLMYPQKIGLG